MGDHLDIAPTRHGRGRARVVLMVMREHEPPEGRGREAELGEGGGERGLVPGEPASIIVTSDPSRQR